MRCTRKLAIGALGLLLVACGERAAEIQHVVIVSIDTLRADALGSYGNPRETTPRLDAIARQGLRAASCIAPTPACIR
jgi:arylsulfatase A-like enzyme